MSSKKKPKEEQSPTPEVQTPERPPEQPPEQSNDQTPESPEPESPNPVDPTDPIPSFKFLMGKSHAQLVADIEEIKGVLNEHSLQIADLQAMMEKKYAPRSNGKTKIRDTQTGEIYPSKNNCYQSLLKAGDLKELVSKGVFGVIPEKNNFGWFALNRAYPDRFEEVKDEEIKEADTNEVEIKEANAKESEHAES